VEVAKIPSGEVIGELSFFDRLPRSATAVALLETEVHEIPFEALEKIYQNIPDFMKTFVVTLADRLRKANDQVKQLRASRQWDDAATVEFSSETQVDPNKT
jgi:CRP/FNR family transcriptional regulator, cyclic AMP receptor protein